MYMMKVIFQILSGIKYLILGIVLFGFVKITIPNYVHHCELHSADPILHGNAEEADPCHRAIYHGDNHHGCKHPQHISKGFNKCGLEDLFYVFHIELPDFEKPHYLVYYLEEFISNAEYDVLNALSVFNIRGPPVCI